MARKLVYLTFGDTFDPDDESALDAAVLCVQQQFMAAAEKIKTDPTAINQYLRIDSGFDSPVKTSENSSTQPSDTEPAKALVSAPSVITEAEMLDKIFSQLKRTQKSQKIMSVFVQNPGTELSIEDLQNATGLLYPDLNSWLNSTGKIVGCISRPARGKYKFNPDHVK